MESYFFTDEATIAKISDMCPRAMSTYFICLWGADNKGVSSFTRHEIVHDRIKSWTKFKNDIRSLASIYILNYVDKGDEILIELITEEK